MGKYTNHIKTILSVVMFGDEKRNYYLNQYMVDDIHEFKRELNNALDYYSLPMSADDIIIYEVIENDYEDQSESESESEDDEFQQIGYGLE